MIIRSKLSILLVLIIAICPFTYNPLIGQAFKEIKFEVDSLPNGLKVIYHIDRSAPVVATVMQYKVGSTDEETNLTGFAHFFEHLMFEATDNIPRTQIDSYTQEAGGDLNASTGFDETTYYFRLPSNQIKLALWIESERMRKLKLESVGIETQRNVVIEELKMRYYNQPYGTMLENLLKKMYPESGYGWSPAGSIEHLLNATEEQFREFYQLYYQPNNAVLVIAGDIDLAETKKYVNEYFGDYTRKEVPRFNEIKDSVFKSESITVKDEIASLPALFWGKRSVQSGHPDGYALDLLAMILTNGNSSILHSKLVDREQLAISVNLDNYQLQSAGFLLLQVILKDEDDFDEVIEIINSTIEEIVKKGINESDLIKAKNNIETQYVFSLTNVLDKARQLAQYEAYHGNPELINSELNKYKLVTSTDIIKVAKKYLSKNKNIEFKYMPSHSN